MISPAAGLRVSLGMALIALVMVAMAENGRIPMDNPATHLELTMVHEAMMLEYSGRHLALIELSASLKLLLYISLIACVFTPWGIAREGSRISSRRTAAVAYVGKLAVGGAVSRAVRNDNSQNARLPRSGFRRRGADAEPFSPFFSYSFQRASDDARSCLRCRAYAGGRSRAGSFMLLYQDRLYALLNVFALQAVVLALSVAGRPTSSTRRTSILLPRSHWCSRRSSSPIAFHRIVASSGFIARLRRWSGSVRRCSRHRRLSRSRWS